MLPCSLYQLLHFFFNLVASKAQHDMTAARWHVKSEQMNIMWTQHFAGHSNMTGFSESRKIAFFTHFHPHFCSKTIRHTKCCRRPCQRRMDLEWQNNEPPYIPSIFGTKNIHTPVTISKKTISSIQGNHLLFHSSSQNYNKCCQRHWYACSNTKSHNTHFILVFFQFKKLL